MSESSEDLHVGSSSVQPRGKKRKQYVAWRHMAKTLADDGTKTATCNHCKKVLTRGADNGTSHLLKHLRKSCPCFKLLAPGTSTRVSPRLNFIFDQMKSRKLLATACIKHKYPFNIGDHDHFYLFLKSLNPDFILPCRNTIRSDVIDVYNEEKVIMYAKLDSLQCRVSLTTDVWTSDHAKIAYCCVTCHYIDDDWKLNKKIIAFRKTPYPHIGDHLFTRLRDVILEWNLDKKLCSLVVDNASNNDSMVKKMKEWLVSDSLLYLGGELLHVKCSAHILNLIVQDGLGVINGLIENMRETVRYLNKSSGAQQRFEQAKNQCGLGSLNELAMDVPHRWNSTYKLLLTVLPLKEVFSRFAMLDERYRFNPSEEEWQVMEIILGFLKVFYDATKKFSGSTFPTPNIFFKHVCEINLKLIEWSNSDVEYIKKMTAPMKVKFDKYWDKCNLVLAVAVVLDPRLKMHFVEFKYGEIYGAMSGSYIVRVRDALDDLFVSYGGVYRASSDITAVGGSSGQEFDYFNRWLRQSRSSRISEKSDRIRAAVKYVKYTPNRLKKINDCISHREDSHKMLCLDVPTRWNSTYDMLSSTLSLKKAFYSYDLCERSFAQDLGEHVPRESDWKKAKIFVEFLEPFKRMTELVSGATYVTSNKVYQEIAAIDEILAKWLEVDDDADDADLELKAMTLKMKEKYDKYWGATPRMNHLIYYAVILDPRYKYYYFTVVLDDEDLKDAIQDGFKELFIEYKKMYEEIQVPSSPSPKFTVGTTGSMSMKHTNFLRSKTGKTRQPRSELEKYFKDALEDENETFDILKWWKENCGRYPILSRMARDILAIPVSTVASESAFSTGGRILDRFRSSLTPRMVQSVICYQDWLRDDDMPLDIEESILDLENRDKDFAAMGQYASILED